MIVTFTLFLTFPPPAKATSSYFSSWTHMFSWSGSCYVFSSHSSLALLFHYAFRLAVAWLLQLQDLTPPPSWLLSVTFLAISLPLHPSFPSWYASFSHPLSVEFLLGLTLGVARWQAGIGQRPNLRPQCARPLPPAGRQSHTHFLPLNFWPAGGRLVCHSRQTLLGMLCGAWLLPGKGERDACWSVGLVFIMHCIYGISFTLYADSKWMWPKISVFLILCLAGGSRAGG